ncbi:hypothetical protein [Agromyces sp. Leaf222]|uniref:hypothetical protein n=1 Tax=Agromyces sp. Leaf222 TaxID=1735688 RepID=UPI0012FCF513|nr:hypothetical protein [Agromyces sp. Leaf222]
MNADSWLAVICLSAVVGPLLLGLVALRRRPQPVRVRADRGQRPVNRSIDR